MFQVTKQLAVPKCAVFIDIHGQITCNLEEAVRWIDNIQERLVEISLQEGNWQITFVFLHEVYMLSSGVQLP